MTKRIELTEKIELRGRKLVATLHTVESMNPLEFIQIYKGLMNEINNRKDEIKNLENQKDKLQLQIDGQNKSIASIEKRLEKTFKPKLRDAKRVLNKKEIKELKELEKQEAKLEVQKAELMKAYATAKMTATDLDERKEALG